MAYETVTITRSWQRFVQGLRVVLEQIASSSSDDYFSAVRHAALALAESSVMSAEIEAGYRSSPSREAAEIVVQEIDIFADIAAAAGEDGKISFGKRTLQILFRSGKTVIGSVGDIFKMTEKGKALLKLLEEGVDLTGVAFSLDGEDQIEFS